MQETNTLHYLITPKSPATFSRAEALRSFLQQAQLCSGDAPDVLPDRGWEAGVHAEGNAAPATCALIAYECRCSRTVLPSCVQKETPEGKPTESAHPARFSPDDKFSKQRLICKRRFGLLPMQKPTTQL